MNSKNQCKNCLKYKDYIYKGQKKTGQNIYVDEEENRWIGQVCSDCHSIKCRDSYRAKNGVPVLLITICPLCSIEFKQKQPNQKFCSLKCSRKQKWQKFKNLKPKAKCLHCSKDLPHRGRKYCNNQCYKAYNYKPRVFLIKICKQCPNEFNVKSRKRMFCSNRCYYLSKRKPKKIKKHIEKLITLKKYNLKQCLICSNDYKSNYPNAKYCSKACSYESGREYRRIRKRMRKSRKSNKLTLWGDINKIREVYNNCPEGYVVDHIIPLNGETVSGFHVEYNLQYLPSKVNNDKSNKFDGTYDNLNWIRDKT